MATRTVGRGQIACRGARVHQSPAADQQLIDDVVVVHSRLRSSREVLQHNEYRQSPSSASGVGSIRKWTRSRSANRSPDLSSGCPCRAMTGTKAYARISSCRGSTGAQTGSTLHSASWSDRALLTSLRLSWTVPGSHAASAAPRQSERGCDRQDRGWESTVDNATISG